MAVPQRRYCTGSIITKRRSTVPIFRDGSKYIPEKPMAKKNKDEKFNYAESVKALRQNGPGRLYMIWGAEDYLSEQYYLELKKLCLSGGEDDFSFHRLTERDFTALKLAEAIDSIPFLSERSLVELRDLELNKLPESDEVLKILSDIPDYCTVVFINDGTFEPDKRLKLIKGILKSAVEIHTTAQSGDALIRWIVKRFAACGKQIDLAAAQRLISVSGDLMNRLIPEIGKLAAYAKDERVTVGDVDAVAHHIPEAVVFDMTEKLAAGEVNTALALLAELLSDKNNEPIMIAAVLGNQMRKLYAARVAAEEGLGAAYLMKTAGIRYEFIASRLMAAARRFSMPRLIRGVELCVEADYAMKSSGGDSVELLKDCVIRIAAGEDDVQSV